MGPGGRRSRSFGIRTRPLPPPPDEDDDDDDVGDEDGRSSSSGNKRKYRAGGTAAGIDDPDLGRLVARLISMSSSSSRAGGVGVGVGVEEDSAGGGGGGAPDVVDPSTRKRRRRGRQGGERGEPSPSPGDVGGWGDAGAPRGGVNRRAIVGGTTRDEKIGDEKEEKKMKLHSLWINYNRSWRHSNAIFAYDVDCWRRVCGPRAVVEHLAFGDGGAALRPHQLARPMPPPFQIPLNFPPNVFRQANLDAFAGIVGRIRERIARDFGGDGGDDAPACVELYGGVGTIGLHLSDIVSSLVCSDENPNNERCFLDSARALPSDVRPRLAYVRKSAADMIASEPGLFRGCRVLIVDPPRKGLDVEVVEYLCGEGGRDVGLVVYVSCGFRAFQRDCDALIGSGRWRVDFAEGYLLFPGSDAIETLAFFVPA